VLVAPGSVHWEIGNALSAMFKREAIHLDQALKLLEAYSAIPVLNIFAYDGYVIARSGHGI
jgi:hypothetical protein